MKASVDIHGYLSHGVGGRKVDTCEGCLIDAASAALPG